MTISEPMPETISISTTASWSTWIISGTWKLGEPAQVYSVKTWPRELSSSPRIWKNTIAAHRNAAKAKPVPSQAATSRVTRVCSSASSATPASGRNRQSQDRVSIG